MFSSWSFSQYVGALNKKNLVWLESSNQESHFVLQISQPPMSVFRRKKILEYLILGCQDIKQNPSLIILGQPVDQWTITQSFNPPHCFLQTLCDITLWNLFPSPFTVQVDYFSVNIFWLNTEYLSFILKFQNIFWTKHFFWTQIFFSRILFLTQIIVITKKNDLTNIFFPTHRILWTLTFFGPSNPAY